MNQPLLKEVKTMTKMETMMTNLQIFESAQFGAVRTIVEHEKILFCGIDIARALGYKNVNYALKEHCPSLVKYYVGVQTGLKADGTPARQTLRMNFITEGDVYRLAARSKLPTAAQFESWIFDEVLPTIRRAGLYATDKLLENPDLALEAFSALKAEREKRLAAETQLAENLPKVQYADAVTASKSTILVGDLAKILKQNGVDIGQNRLFEYLRRNGYLIRSGRRRNMPTQYSMDLELFEISQNAAISPRGVRLTRTPKVTGKGQQYFVKHFQKMIS